MQRVLQIRFVLVVILAGGALLVWWPVEGSIRTPVLTVSFLDVGQGDAILLESPTGTQVLIDGGSGGQVLPVLAAALPRFDRTLDMVVATHPDMDHIGGLVDVLEQYEVAAVLRTENESDTSVMTTFDEALGHEHAEITYARAGQVFSLGGGVLVQVLYPVSDPSAYESNVSSIVLRVSYGAIDFLLTGDSPQSIENYLVDQYGSALQSEVLKAGHHGSRTSTADVFVSAVVPDIAVISAGADNRYGHPHQEVIDRLVAAGAAIRATSEEGTVTFTTDGMTVW